MLDRKFFPHKFVQDVSYYRVEARFDAYFTDVFFIFE